MNKIVMVSACRTAIGIFMTGLKDAKGQACKNMQDSLQNRTAGLACNLPRITYINSTMASFRTSKI